MNTVENHLPLEQAIILDAELKKAGVEMKTEQAWTEQKLDWRFKLEYSKDKKYWRASDYHDILSLNKDKPSQYPAPTLSEIESMLPEDIEVGVTQAEVVISRLNGIRKVCYINKDYEYDYKVKCFEASTLLEAVYEALLWCLREGYVLGKE